MKRLLFSIFCILCASQLYAKTEVNWQGEWIGTDSLQVGESMQKHSRCAVRYFRKEFATHGIVKKAMAHVCGLGYFTLYINGQRVGKDVMAPPQTDFAKSVAFCSYDVTPLINGNHKGPRPKPLAQSNNAIGVAVGAGYFFAPFQNYQTNVRVTYGLPRLRMMLLIDYKDGSREVVTTDKTWRMTTNGPIRYSNIYDGEMYNANLSLGDWTTVGYDDKAWTTPDIVKAPGGRMRGNITPPMRVYEEDKPLSIRKYSDRFIIDFGTNGAGVTEFLVDAAKGDTVKMRYAELLQADDTAGLYTANLRQAQCTDYFVSDGTPRLWHPEFLWHGYRYMEISGVRSLDTTKIRRLLIADDMETDGDSIYIYGNDILNKVISNAYRGIRSNYKSFPIDCPQRDERMPWDGDRTTGCLGESYLMDNHDLYAKWIADFRDSQGESGALSDVTPAYWRLYNTNVTWPAALPFACEMLYRQYGDIKPFKDTWQTITRWLNFVKTKSYKDGLITYDRYGDWCVPPEGPKIVLSKDPARNTDGQLIASSYYYYICKMLASYACLTGNASDSTKYAQEAEATKEAINKAFLHETGYANNTVTANLLPLAMGIVPEEKIPVVKDRLIATIHANDDHISCGVIGIQWLLRYLTGNGYGWLAYKIATQETYPGWGYMVRNGATTIWELWNGNTANPSMNSCNHVMLLGDLLPWCFEHLGGIASGEAGSVLSEESAGFKHIVMKPDFSIAKLNGVYASHRSPYGVIKSHWLRKDGKITWAVDIPDSCTAEVHLPDTILHVAAGHNEIVYDAALQCTTQLGNQKLQVSNVNAQGAAPTMGWSSWNTYRVNISDSLIMKQADAMVSTGLSNLGYKYINIDDGYFGGRSKATGQLLINERRFPNGLKPVVNHIHGLKLKAGIYSDGGDNTCGSYYDKDTLGLGVGLYGHDHQDCELFFNKLGFDFIKVDFCGGVGKKGSRVLDEQERYTAIANAIKEAVSHRQETGHASQSSNLNPQAVRLNVCRWDYPGTWVHDVASSWRTTRDIADRWSVVSEIIKQNLYMKAYAWGGHYNDMDMLEVGRGLTEEEDRTHFGLWCFMNSPLLIGCDLTKIKPATLSLLKNERLIALNQDLLHDQPAVVEKQNGCPILVRDIREAHGNDRAFAVYNPTDSARVVTVDLRKLLLGGKVILTDCFTGEEWNTSSHDNKHLTPNSCLLTIPAHGTAVYTAHCTKRLQQTRYEAEAAYISDYQELKNNQAVGTGIYEYDDNCSGGLKATWLGGKPENDLVFKDVYVDKAGEYTLTVATAGKEYGTPGIEVNGKPAAGRVYLNKGSNCIRLYNDTQRMPDIDYIEIAK